ncbi:hypothetical protein [Sphingomonas kyungheensis]|uniref:Uncharacterized protein n=1 Tax=Sphingomonas kyungheensis TaxID=1069987 RepID=A0ABU8GXM8_9SPHN
MGKKKKAKAKLPKEVLGIRLPKEVREVGGVLLEKANSPQGREWLAAGLTMAATAATAAVAKGQARRSEATRPAAERPVPPTPPATPVPPSGDGPPEPPRPEAPPQGTQTQPDPQAIAAAVGKAAEAMLGRLFGGKAG